MKALRSIGCMLLIMVFCRPIHVAAHTELLVKLDGSAVEYDDFAAHPFIDENNRTLVPYRITLEAYGAMVEWDQDNYTAIASKNDIRIEVPIGADYILRNGEKIMNDTAAIIRDGHTYLPIRAVMEAFGCSVAWHADEKIVAITSLEGLKQSIDVQYQTTALTGNILDRLKMYPYYEEEIASEFGDMEVLTEKLRSALIEDIFDHTIVLSEDERFLTHETLIYQGRDRYYIRGVYQYIDVKGHAYEADMEFGFLASSDGSNWTFTSVWPDIQYTFLNDPVRNEIIIRDK